MSVKVQKKIDRRPELMRSLQTATGKALERAAVLCKGVAKQLVSKRYQLTKEERDRKNQKARDKRRQAREAREAGKPQQQTSPNAQAKAARSRERRAENQRRRRQRARDATSQMQE